METTSSLLLRMDLDNLGIIKAIAASNSLTITEFLALQTIFWVSEPHTHPFFNVPDAFNFFDALISIWFRFKDTFKATGVPITNKSVSEGRE